MLKAVTVTNFKGEKLRMELTKPAESGMLIYDITGIGGGKANINTQDLTTGDGSWFTSAHAQTRNIVMSIKLWPEPSVEENRHKTYRYFPLKKNLTLEFETDTRRVQITGYVESNEPVIFSSQEYTQISILCPDPWFYTAEKTATAFSGVESLFEFPFSNESLSENLIEFSSVRIDDRAIVDYEGDADCGFVLTIHATGLIEDIDIWNVKTYEHIIIDTAKIQQLTGQVFGAGDELLISTVTGDKYVRLLREGKTTNVIGAVNKDSDWFQLTPGINIFDFDARTGAENAMLTITYRTAWGGV